MKSVITMIVVCGVCVGLCGCQGNKTRIGEGAAFGALIGAGAGSIIGHQSGHGGEGAAIGAATGILGGALIGGQIEKQPASAQPAGTAAASSSASHQALNPQQLSLQQIAELSQAGVHEDVIIDRIRLTNSSFSLSDADVDYLKQQGVSAKVIAQMQTGV